MHPNYFFGNKDFSNRSSYENGFNLNELFKFSAGGIKTERDQVSIQIDKTKLNEIHSSLINLDTETFRKIYTPKADGRDWTVAGARKDLLANNPIYTEILYRPFDSRHTIFTGKSKGFMAYPRNNIMSHMINKRNFALLLGRQNKSQTIDSFLITDKISEMKTAERTIQSYHFPLYLYPNSNPQKSLLENLERTPNLNLEIVTQIEKNLNHLFLSDDNLVCDLPAGFDGHFSPLDVLDYIYAILHSPNYRETYKEFLKIDFPRIPYPTDADNFWKLVELGTELREIHLLESPKVNDFITEYHGEGDNLVGKPAYKDGSVFINTSQHFTNVPETTWNFYIGGYQPAQKWLKDRKDRELSFEDILHYQKIIVALTETGRIMGEIDGVGISNKNIKKKI